MNETYKPNILKLLGSRLQKVRSLHRERDKSRSRSSGWDAVRDVYLAAHPTCAACGGVNLLQVHHIVPFSVAPDLELEVSNLLTLCMGDFDCHLRLGHGGSFRCYNPRVIEDAAEFREATLSGRLVVLSEARRRRRRD
jgi:hypothetical protein